MLGVSLLAGKPPKGWYDALGDTGEQANRTAAMAAAEREMNRSRPGREGLDGFL